MKQTDGRTASNAENGRFMRVKDIMTVPAAMRINGQKAISVKGIWAYAQRPDGMTIYRYNQKEGYWNAFKTIIATNC